MTKVQIFISKLLILLLFLSKSWNPGHKHRRNLLIRNLLLFYSSRRIWGSNPIFDEISMFKELHDIKNPDLDPHNLAAIEFGLVGSTVAILSIVKYFISFMMFLDFKYNVKIVLRNGNVEKRNRNKNNR